MKALALNYVWWPGIDADIEEKVNRCYTCQNSRTSLAKAPLHPCEWPREAWHQIHVDYADYKGRNLIIVPDAHSKWIEVYLTGATNSTTKIEKLRCCFPMHSLPNLLVCDNDPCLTSLEFAEFTRKNGIKNKLVSLYHQISNGQTESSVKIVKSRLRRMSGGTLETKLSGFLQSYRKTPHTTTGDTPVELLIKKKLQTNLHRLRPSTSTIELLSQDHQKFHHDRTAKMLMFHKGQEVFAQNLNRSPEWLVGHVLEGIDPLSFLIKLQDGQIIQSHQEHMRARLCSSEPMSPTLVNFPGPEQIEPRLPPQPDTAPQFPIHTPDTVMPENPPVQKSTVVMSTPL